VGVQQRRPVLDEQAAYRGEGLPVVSGVGSPDEWDAPHRYVGVGKLTLDIRRPARGQDGVEAVGQVPGQ
jgi:hypothetical protein